MLNNIAMLIFCTLASLNVITSRPLDPASAQSTYKVFKSEGCNVTESRLSCPDLPPQCCCSPDHSIKDINTTTTRFKVLCTAIKHMTTNMPVGTNKIKLLNTKVVALKQTSFNKTRLTDFHTFFLEYDDALETIEARTFSGLHSLREIEISYVKNLVFISESAFSDLPNLSRLKVKATGLEVVQGFGGLENPSFKLQLLLSENQYLSEVPRDAFSNTKIAEIKIKWNPSLSIVKDYAFNGSHVGILILDDNSALKKLSSNAFAGIKSLEYLSFNNTPVDNLPVAGLQGLRMLNAYNTPHMVRIPRHSDLPKLKKAVLTYPYHCCALSPNYGFGHMFKEDEVDASELVRCDSGEKVNTDEDWLPWEDTSDLTRQTESIISDEFYENPIYILNETDLFNLVDYNNGYEYSGSGSMGDIDIWEPQNTDDDGWLAPSNDYKDSPTNDLPAGQAWVIPPTYAPGHPSDIVTELCHKDKDGKLVRHIARDRMICSPVPDPFSPCENLLGDPGLLIVSWTVAWLAVIGNFFVVFFLLAITFDRTRSHQRHLSVPKFLILNLSIADFCMGVCMLTLSAMDGKTNGQYYKYGIEWQTGGGCDVIGFLSIFASQLSIYTLSVISLERWYAIRYAIQLDKRMTLKCGRIVMLIGWVLSIFFAVLPLVGVNSYQKSSVCLPVDVTKTSGVAYAAVLLTVDVIAFVVVVGSYLWMYAIVRTANGRQKRVGLPEVFKLQPRKSSEEKKPKRKKGEGCFGVMDKRTADARVAKRMAVLVFTDFACVFPLCFFTLFHLAGLPLLTMSTMKILVLACYPFNACCNPFLYAILTKSFRKDVKVFIKSQKRCFNGGDERQKMCRKVGKRSDASSRQEERRKTIQVYVDGDVDNGNGDIGLVSLDAKGTAPSPTSAFVKSKNGAYTSYIFTKAESPTKPKIKNANNNNMKANSRPSNKGSGGTSPSSSEESLSKRFALLTTLARFGISIFKRKKGTVAKSTAPTESTHNSFETQVTANGGTTLFDKIENEGSETEAVVSKIVESVVEASLADNAEHCESFI